MDHEALLRLIAELYGTVSRLTQENVALREQIVAGEVQPPVD